MITLDLKNPENMLLEAENVVQEKFSAEFVTSLM
jgi:hypothetical protein